MTTGSGMAGERPNHTPRIRLLIADDRAHSRYGLRALANTWLNIEVAGEASNGREALQLLDTCQPDVVLMDVRMPVMDGLAATRRIKESRPQIKVVILTMYPMHRAEALKAGADAFLVKGCATEELFNALVGPDRSEHKSADQDPE